MEKEFKKILTLLTKLNKSFPPKKHRSASVQLENRRMKDLISLDKKTIKHLALLEKLPPSSTDEIMGQICRLNVFLNTYIWHVQSIQELIEKLVPKDLKHD